MEFTTPYIDSIELTILMPCLNEAETIAACVSKALASLRTLGIQGEVLVADNGSTDGSQAIATELGARVIPIPENGYGAALRGGIEAANGKYIIMGDADDSYDFSDLGGFVDKLREGVDLVIGCRLPAGGGTIKPGAMPWKNRWLGNPVLSWIGRTFYRTPIHDFHCGMRGFSKEAYKRMQLQTTGMEFASEMIMKATLKNMWVAEVPITLHPDGRSRPPHLRPWRDGWRHLRFMLIYSPRWLFFVPGMALTLLGIGITVFLLLFPLRVQGVVFDVGTLVMACMAILLGIQSIAFALYTKVFAIGEGLLPEDPEFGRLFRYMTLEKGIITGLVTLAIGLCVVAKAIWIWSQSAYGSIPYAENLRRLIPAATLIVIGIQTILSSFFLSVLGLKTTSRKPPEVG